MDTGVIVVGNTALAAAPNIGISSAIERFLNFAGVKTVTAKSYAVALRCFSDWLQDNGISRPERDDIIQYQKYLEAPHPARSRTDRPTDPARIITFSDGTQARYMRAVKMFFRWTSQEKPPYYYPNIADNVKGTKVSIRNHKRDALEREDALTVLNAIDRQTAAGKRDYAMILLSITAGLRIIEIQRAKLENLEMLNKEHILYIQGKGHDSADEWKKLTPEVYSAIQDYLATRKNLNKESPLFCSVGNRSREQHLSEPSISRIIKDRLRQAGYDTHRLSAHSLRHSSVTFLLESGATIQEAQHHARHASPDTTGIYAHNIDQKKQHTEQRISDFLFGKEIDAPAQAADCLKRMTTAQQEQAIALLKAIIGEER